MKTDILRAAAESPLARTIKVQEVAVRMTWTHNVAKLANKLFQEDVSSPHTHARVWFSRYLLAKSPCPVESRDRGTNLSQTCLNESVIFGYPFALPACNLTTKSSRV